MKRALVLAALLLAGCARPPGGVPAADAERGRLLYDTACSACHTTQAHWREKRVVVSWEQLLYQVNRWQLVAGQGWSEPDIRDVGAYLNGAFYRMPCQVDGCGAPGG